MPKPSKHALTSFAALAGLAALGTPARAEDWSSLGLTAAQTRLTGERSGGNFGASTWVHAVHPDLPLASRSLLGSPAVADGYLVLATQANTVTALRERDGQVLWQAHETGPVYGSPTIGRGLAYVLGGNHKLYAFRLADGQVAWQRALASFGPASPVVADDALFVPSAFPRTRVQRLRADTGELQWESGAGVLTQSAMSSITLAAGRVLVGEITGKLHSFAASEGQWQWTAESHGQSGVGAPLVLGDRVYLLRGGDRARLYAFDLATGTAVSGWPLDLPAPPEPTVGSQNTRALVVSSLAGVDDLLLLALRADDQQDRNGDGASDAFSCEEEVMAVSISDREIVWRARTGRLETDDAEKLPGHAQVPTPALYREAGGSPLAAVASTLGARVRVLSATTGQERASLALPAPTRGSPLLANGRLVLATDAGTVHSFPSRANQAPAAPTLGLSPDGGDEADTAGLRLRWGAAVDPEGGSVRYEVRLDDDGEILRDWKLRVITGESIQELRLDERLAAGRTYTFAVRAQDRAGAYAPWSYAASFKALDTPAVTVDGQPASNLTEAVSKARPGQVIILGAGIFPLPATLRLPRGATLQGAGPHLTTLRGRNLAVGVSPGAGSGLRHLTVAEAKVGVALEDVQGVRLQNLILRDNSEAGLHVKQGGSGEVINVTAARNGTGLNLEGPTHVRNSLIWGNEIGVAGLAPVLIDSRYNDVAGNRVEDWRNARPGPHDLAQPVAFEPVTAGDPDADAGLRLKAAQPTTDKGDPTDDWSEEPSPNGGRINIGAFGNTRFAELSGEVAPPGNPPVTQPGPEPAPPVVPTPIARARGGGGLCALADDRGRPDGALLLVLGALLLARRGRRHP